MTRNRTAAFAAVLPLLLVTSCAVVNTPVTTMSGSGVPAGSAVSIVGNSATAEKFQPRIHALITAKLIRAGYQVTPDAEFILDFSIASRPSEIGILLDDSEKARSGTRLWRSRPKDRGDFALCTTSLYRLMLAVSRKQTGEVIFLGSSDNDLCGDVSDEKLNTLVSASIFGLRQNSIGGR